MDSSSLSKCKRSSEQMITNDKPPPRRKKRQRRPDPPPPPPQPLVDLLRHDASVLAYFAALQANLDYDVKVWKDRAEDWQTQCEGKKEKTSPNNKRQRSSTTTSKKKPPSEANNLPKSNPPKKEKKAARGSGTVKEATQNEGEEELNDAMFEILSTSSDDNDVHSSNHDIVATPNLHSMINSGRTGDLLVTGSEQGRNNGDDNDMLEALELLQEAYNILDRLGIAVVDHTVAEASMDDSLIQEGEVRMTTAVQPGTIFRRSNEAVLDDIFAMIKQTIQAEPADALFAGAELVPACSQTLQHAILQAKDDLIRALIILDAYSEPVTSGSWEPVFTNNTPHDEALRIGLTGRKVLVDELVSQLSHEIKSGWGHADRMWRIETKAWMYEPSSLISHAGITCAVGSAESRDRLSTMIERRWLVEVLVGILWSRNDLEIVGELILSYILATVPAVGGDTEEHPRLPPVLSFVALEGLLQTSLTESSLERPWFAQFLRNRCTADGETEILTRSLAFCLHAVALIWQERRQSTSLRISECSRVEIAAFERIQCTEMSWTQSSDRFAPGAGKAIESVIACAKNGLARFAKGHTSIPWRLSNTLMHVVIGCPDVIQRTSRLLSSMTKTGCCNDENMGLLCALLDALRQLEIRQLPKYRQSIGSFIRHGKDFHQLYPIVFADMILKIFESHESAEQIPFLICGLELCAQMSDGVSCWRIADKILRRGLLSGAPKLDKDVSCSLIDAIVSVGSSPVVRVINLERRKDRRKAFQSQAVLNDILVVNALPLVERPTKDGTTHFFGDFAIDGISRGREVIERLCQVMGAGSKLDAFVTLHWRPHDLKAFDFEAPDDEALVETSLSEQSCALSHVLSWSGVQKSLLAGTVSGKDSMCDRNTHLMRAFLVGGFAEGEPLHVKNDIMPPAPVCIILEDDAILVDNFRSKLRKVLQELPRDFHMCSLGYSRPKTAPIAKLTEHVGIPTCQYYLTGYLLSLAGAEYLLGSLPVVGPVDTWIGLKQLSNWDNSFGAALGVGKRHKVYVDAPPRRDLAKLLRFQVYCAVPPLCTQRVNSGVADPETAGRNWRANRDTDIEYSGDSLKGRRGMNGAKRRH